MKIKQIFDGDHGFEELQPGQKLSDHIICAGGLLDDGVRCRALL